MSVDRVEPFILRLLGQLNQYKSQPVRESRVRVTLARCYWAGVHDTEAELGRAVTSFIQKTAGALDAYCENSRRGEK